MILLYALPSFSNGLLRKLVDADGDSSSTPSVNRYDGDSSDNSSDDGIGSYADDSTDRSSSDNTSAYVDDSSGGASSDNGVGYADNTETSDANVNNDISSNESTNNSPALESSESELGGTADEGTVLELTN